jgi:hypothetical protein
MNFFSERAKTKGNTGSMQGLKMVSTPPKNTNMTIAMRGILLLPY